MRLIRGWNWDWRTLSTAARKASSWTSSSWLSVQGPWTASIRASRLEMRRRTSSSSMRRSMELVSHWMAKVSTASRSRLTVPWCMGWSRMMCWRVRLWPSHSCWRSSKLSVALSSSTRCLGVRGTKPLATRSLRSRMLLVALAMRTRRWRKSLRSLSWTTYACTVFWTSALPPLTISMSRAMPSSARLPSMWGECVAMEFRTTVVTPWSFRDLCLSM
mmetsp:Transcript_10588/g.30338  ORF Transcript_10588/g.30338 Transcript_10588/m.30338 type:complete len:217 (+) Transcript_10588:631-1281(+)